MTEQTKAPDFRVGMTVRTTRDVEAMACEEDTKILNGSEHFIVDVDGSGNPCLRSPLKISLFYTADAFEPVDPAQPAESQEPAQVALNFDALVALRDDADREYAAARERFQQASRAADLAKAKADRANTRLLHVSLFTDDGLRILPPVTP